MFGNALASSSFRCAWNRVVPRGKPFVGIFRNSVSTLSRQEVKPKQTNIPSFLSHSCKKGNVAQPISKRAYGSSAPNSGGNTVLIVGLGALGLASFAVVKSNILSIDGGPVKKAKETVTDVTAEEIKANAEEAEVETGQIEASVSEVSTEVYSTPEEVDAVAVSPEEGSAEGQPEVQPQVQPETQTEELTVVADDQGFEHEKEILTAQENSAKAVETEKDTEVTNQTTTENVAVDEAKEINEQKEKVSDDKEVAAVDKKEVDIKELPKIPTYAPYVIIGGGTASHAACRSIRKHDPNAKILVIGDEEVLPYMRPPLSKELWFGEDEEAADTLYFKQWNGKRRSVFFEDDTYYVKPQILPVQEHGGIAVLTGHRVTSIDPVSHKLQLKHGQEIQYDKLLIATGGYPKNIELFEKSSDELKSKVTLFRTVADYRKLDRLVRSLDSVAIVGGGFLGSELACALGAKGKQSGLKVAQIYHEGGNMGKVLPAYLSDWTTKKVENEGVKIYPHAELVSADLTEDGKVSIALNSGEKVDASHVIVCVGIDPNTELAATAGLETDPDLGGFRVNSELQARSDIWVAGDAACFYDVKLGRRRVEHHDHAVVSGRLAGENMTGGKRSYLHQSMFWSDLGPNVGYEAIGIVDNTLDTVGIWAKATKVDSPKAVVEATGENLRSQTEEDAGESEAGTASIEVAAQQEELSEDFGKGVVFYLKNDVVVGILLWNVFNKMPVARKILKEGKKQESLVELAKLFNIHE